MDMNPSPWAPGTITRHSAKRTMLNLLVEALATFSVIAILMLVFWEDIEPLLSLIGKAL